MVEESVNSDIPHLYCNGFTNVLGIGDILLVLQSNHKPQATLNLSYSVAKTLSIKLEEMVKVLEK